MRNPVMVGERVYLRAIEAEDAMNDAAMAATETDTFMYRGRSPESPLAFEHYIAEKYKEGTPGQVEFAVCLKETDELIGFVEIDDVDWVNRTGETGSFFAPVYRNQGYGPEAKHLLLEYGFDHLHLFAMSSFVYEANTRSAAALGKQGYRPAGRIERQDVKNGVYGAFLVFDVQRVEWLAARDVWRAQQRERRVARDDTLRNDAAEQHRQHQQQVES